VNAVVVVLQKGRNTVPAAAEAFQSLKEANVPLLGSVIYE